MAIDKNSKAYQWLIAKGYTDEQITQMSNSVASWKTTQQAFDEVKSQSWATTGGSYTYNPTSWYYEKQTTTTTTPTKTNGDEYGRTTPPAPTPTNQWTVSEQTKTQGNTVSEIKQEWALKPQTQEYYNQTSDEALNKIRDNLNNYRQTNPEYFTNYEDFKKNFSYDARNDEQKNVLDTWYTWYSKGLELSATPVTDLYTQYQNWEISINDLENLRISNPTKYAELTAQINKWNIISAYDDDKGTDSMNIQEMAYQMAAQTFKAFMEWGSWASNIFSEYEEKMNDPEMLSLSDQCTEYEAEIEQIQDDIASMRKQVEAEYEGTWASRAKINAIIADRTYDLQLQLRTANSNYNKVANQYNNRMQQYQQEYTMKIQEYQLNMQARNQQMNELWFAMDLMNFETNEQKQEREWNYWVKQQQYTNGDINSSDYSTRYKAALKSVENLLSQYEWIPMIRSAEQMAQDVLKAIDEWSDLGTELTKINKQIQQKPEYKQIYNATFGTSTEKGITDTYDIDGTKYVVYNGKLMTATEFNRQFWWSTGNAKPYDAVDEKVFENNQYVNRWFYTLWEFLSDKRYQTKQKGWQCAKFVNDYLEKIWVGRYFWNEDITTRASWANSDTPKVWTIAIFDYGKTSSDWINHGHVAIVTEVNKDWSFKVRESNFPSGETIGERTIQPWSTSLKWFFDPSQWARSVSESATLTNTLTTKDQEKASAMLKQIRSWAMTNSDMSSARDRLIDNGYGKDFEEALDKWLKLSLSDAQIRMRNDANNTFKSNSIVKEFEESINQIEQLQTALNDASWVGDMSAIFTFMKTLDPTSVVRESEFNSAAATAWVLNPQAIWQSLERSVDWKFLTAKQREDFKKIAKEFIKTKASNYQIKYNDLKKDYNNAGIDEQWLPTNMADVVLAKLDTPVYETTAISSTWTPSWYSELPTTWWSSSYVNINWYEFSSTR